MCQFYSPIVTRKLKILDCVDTDDSHETIIKEFKLKDDKLENRDFVRLEIIPDFNKLSKRFNQKTWEYKVDEEGTLPSWYKKKEKEIKKKVFNRLKEIYKKSFVFDGEVEIKKGRVWLFGKASAELRNSSSAKLWGSSNAIIYSCKKIELNDNSAAIDRRGSKIKLLKA